MVEQHLERDILRDDDVSDAVDMAGGAFANSVAGAAVGAVTGAVPGKAIAERIDPSAEDEHWRSNYSSRPYVTRRAHYEDYRPAYRLGYNLYPNYHGRKFDEVEHEFGYDWDSVRGNSRLSWNEARHATRDAFQRAADTVERWTPGDPDPDGERSRTG